MTLDNRHTESDRGTNSSAELDSLLSLADQEAGEPAGIRLARDNWQQLAPYLENVRHLLPAVAILGLIASLLDGVGISLAILLLYTLFTKDNSIADAEGPFGALFERVISWTDGDPIILGLALFTLLVTRIAINAGYGIMVSRVEQQINDDARGRLYSALVRAPFSRVMTYRKGQLFAIFDRHVNAPSEVLDAYYGLTRSLIAFVILGAMVFAASWPIALMAGIGSFLFMFATRPLQQSVADDSQASADGVNAMNGVLANTLDAMRTIRIFGRENYFIGRFVERSATLRHLDMKLEVKTTLADPLTEFFYLFLIAMTLALALSNGMPVLESLTAIALLSRLQPYVTDIETNRLSLAQMSVPMRVLSKFTGLCVDEASKQGNARSAPLNPSITFRDIDFNFGEKRVLANANATLHKGKWTFISGPSGSGKSTLINLIAGLYTPDMGEVLLDDIPLNNVDRSSWLDQLAFAGQDVELFEGTIAENLLLGSVLDNETDFHAIMSDADIYDFVKSLTHGLSTPVTDRALDLSGGQRQRIGIARALVKKPAILLLDEATSAVDSASEARIFAALRKRMAGATVIVISHHNRQILPGDCELALQADGSLKSSIH